MTSDCQSTLEFTGAKNYLIPELLRKHFKLTESKSKLRSHTFGTIIRSGTIQNTRSEKLDILLIDLERDEFYSEWYLTVDAKKGIVTLSEKNNEYREPFLNTFSERQVDPC